MIKKKMVGIVAVVGLISCMMVADLDARGRRGRPGRRPPPGLLNRIDAMFRFVLLYEPDRIGPVHNKIRGSSDITNPANPAVKITYPSDGETVPTLFSMQIALENWQFAPDRAVNPQTNYADGTRERQIGHTHVWFFNYDTGEQVLFLGAGSNFAKLGATGLITGQLNLPPGRYKAYISLQNHDHTVANQASAAALPPADAVAFIVQ